MSHVVVGHHRVRRVFWAQLLVFEEVVGIVDLHVGKVVRDQLVNSFYARTLTSCGRRGSFIRDRNVGDLDLDLVETLKLLHNLIVMPRKKNCIKFG